MCDRCWELDHRIQYEPSLARKILDYYQSGEASSITLNLVHLGPFYDAMMSRDPILHTDLRVYQIRSIRFDKDGYELVLDAIPLGVKHDT